MLVHLTHAFVLFADFPEHEEDADQPRDYKFIKWMTKNKVKIMTPIERK